MNLEEVARRAGVSTATVSRVLNNIDVVRNSTRTRVMKAVEELNYHPNLHARSLAGGKSRTIGMIVSNLENPFFFDIFHALEADAHANSFEVLVANTAYQPEQLTRSVQLMIGRRVAGLAVVVSEMDTGLIDLLRINKIPTVFYDVGTTSTTISNIRVNYRVAIEKLVNHLDELGHRRLAFVGHHTSLGPVNERERAFVEAVESRGDAMQHKVATNQDGFEGGRDAAREILDSGLDPTAIVCANDFMAIGVIRELRDRKLRVPEDVSVTGFDNLKLAEFCEPRLTTAHVPRDQIGHLAFEMLTPDDANSGMQGREVVIEPELVVRASTGPVRA